MMAIALNLPLMVNRTLILSYKSITYVGILCITKEWLSINQYIIISVKTYEF